MVKTMREFLLRTNSRDANVICRPEKYLFNLRSSKSIFRRIELVVYRQNYFYTVRYSRGNEIVYNRFIHNANTSMANIICKKMPYLQS